MNSRAAGSNPAAGRAADGSRVVVDEHDHRPQRPSHAGRPLGVKLFSIRSARLRSVLGRKRVAEPEQRLGRRLGVEPIVRGVRACRGPARQQGHQLVPKGEGGGPGLRPLPTVVPAAVVGLWRSAGTAARRAKSRLRTSPLRTVAAISPARCSGRALKSVTKRSPSPRGRSPAARPPRPKRRCPCSLRALRGAERRSSRPRCGAPRGA